MYPVSEDSVFFAEFLKKYFAKLTKQEKSKLKYLDMGTGSGILSETAISSGINKDNILAIDINKESVKFVKNKLKINTKQSNLFSKITKKPKYSLITFNAPYLPEHKYDKQKDTTGGKLGDEVSLKFIKQAKSHLAKQGKIFLLISSLTPINRINKTKPKPIIIAENKLFMETLLILEF